MEAKRLIYLLSAALFSPSDIAETLWRKLKTEWLYHKDYLEKDALFYSVNRCIANVGKHLNIRFSQFNAN
ncbi:hypothetical protein [Chryseobacterium potabilaquae]|uniref:hypothetical protein n=1 Tax=Chryseobacterium potabilaquae TaxID=2675057 RepID=UPI001E4E222D|nr:hypothetical protein [Chryseobacterium potabilaquae]